MNSSTIDSDTAVEFVTGADQIPESLWAACFPPPFEGLFWYRALERSGLEDQFQFHYAVIRCGDRPVGIAPCFVHDVPIALVAPASVAWTLALVTRLFPRAGYQRTFFVGSPCADEGTVGVVPGTALADIVAPLIAAVRRKARLAGARMIVFKDFPERDVAALAGDGTFVTTLSYPGTVVRLPGPDREAYDRSLSHNHRHNLRKKLRRSRDLLALDTRVVVRPKDPEIAEIFGLFHQTYERGKTKFERLGPEFFAAIREANAARFILQRDAGTGELVAFMLVFDLGDRLVNKFIGLDYRRAGKTYLYFRLFDAAIDYAYGIGASELQSGQTGYRAKFDVGHTLVPLFNVFRHEQPLVHALFRFVGRRITWRSLDSDLADYLQAHPDLDRTLARK